MEIHDKLTQWGVWAFQNRGVKLGYGKNILGPEFSGKRVYITDDEAMTIDEAISALRQADEAAGDAVMMHYLGHTVRDTARLMATSRSRVSTLITQGRSWLDGYLFCLDRVR